MPPREQIFLAIKALMDSVTWTRADNSTGVFVTKSRRVKLFADVVSEQQPSCFQAEHDEEIVQKTNLPYKTVLGANWIIFQDTARDPSVSGVIENNLIVDATFAAFAPAVSDPGFFDKRNTLGGLVYKCFISGRIFKDPGDIDGQGMMVIPIKILVP